MLNCNWLYFEIWMILYLNRWKNRIIFNRLINSNLWHVVSENTVLFYIRMAHSLSSSIRCVQSCITDRVWIIQTRLVESSRWLTFYEYLLFPAVNFRSETTQISINFATRLINVSSCPLSLYNFRYFIKCAKLERRKKNIFTVEWTNERDWIYQENPNRFVSSLKSRFNVFKNYPINSTSLIFIVPRLQIQYNVAPNEYSSTNVKLIDVTKREIETMKQRKVLVSGHC